MPDPIPPEGCICASFWTVRGTHKPDCPCADPTKEPDELEVVLVKALRAAFAYAYNKGQRHDQEPDQVKAGKIKDEAYTALTALINGRVTEARITEVENIPIHENSDGTVVDQLMPVYQATRLAALRSPEKGKPSDKRYRKKPVVVEALRFTPETDWDEVYKFCPAARPRNGQLYIKTLEGDMHVSDGDYIIKGVKGEFYPCKPDIFEATYQAVAESE